MKGFDTKWPSLPDYILGVTREIWEERNIASIENYFVEDVPVRSPDSIGFGTPNISNDTMAKLAAFPDQQLLGEDVIWSGSAEVGFLASHRILNTATHGSDGVYGAASGTRLVYRSIVESAARDNQIYDQWWVRDTGAILNQLGIAPALHARALIEREGGPDNCARPWTVGTDIQGLYRSRGNDHAAGQRYVELLHRIMNGDLAAIYDEYDRACLVELPGGKRAHGCADVDNFWMNLRSALPDAKFDVAHVIGRDDPGQSPRAAVRWTLSGRHTGWGAFGAPTGAQVDILAMSHAEFGPRGLNREFVLLDESAIWKQIVLNTG